MKAAYKNANNLHLEDRQKGRQTDEQTDRRAEGQSDRQKDKQWSSTELSSNLSRPKYTVARLVSLTAIKASHRYCQPEQEGLKDSKQKAAGSQETGIKKKETTLLYTTLHKITASSHS